MIRVVCLLGRIWALSLWIQFGTVCANDESELAREATWDYPTAEQLRSEIDVWLAERELDPSVERQIENLWSDAHSGGSQDVSDEGGKAQFDTAQPNANERDLARRELNSRVIETIRLVSPESIPFIDACYTAHLDAGRVVLPETKLLQDVATPAIIRDNLRLLVGGWLADHRLYNEALLQLEPIEVGNVADPGKLLFYTAATHYRLLNREKGLQAIAKLLERTGDIPRRYDTVAQMMQLELKALKEDSLDEVARLMDNIQVRLGHGRAGKRVRAEEDDVVAKLDKMIEELEEKRKKQQQQGKDGKGGKQSSRPMQQSKAADGKGPGNVDLKRLAEEIDWGDLPPKDREEALQRLGTEFPSHYREVIEEYFRRLARKEVETP